MNPLDQKINEQFPGLVVRKDLVKLVKGNAIVPSYVLEYLLGQYCATSDEASIQSGIKSVREIVRVNHLKNCLLCHAPSTSRRDLVRAPVPSPNQPLPRVYYASSRGALVRADVTYLKQDFAVRHPVQNHGKWPAMQRFDYFVRERPSDKHESAAWAKRNPAASPYRKAALFALRKLTGKDVGKDSKAWRRLLDDG